MIVQPTFRMLSASHQFLCASPQNWICAWVAKPVADWLAMPTHQRKGVRYSRKIPDVSKAKRHSV